MPSFKRAKLTLSILLMLLIARLLCSYLAPSDLVEIRLRRVPADVSTIYLVAKKQGQVFPLNWYQSMVYYFPAEPKYAGEQWYWTVRGNERKGKMQWVSADSYGILARLKSGRWVLWWLRPEHIDRPSIRRYIWGGGEEVTIQAFGIETCQKAPNALVQQVKGDD